MFDMFVYLILADYWQWLDILRAVGQSLSSSVHRVILFFYSQELLPSSLLWKEAMCLHQKLVAGPEKTTLQLKHDGQDRWQAGQYEPFSLMCKTTKALL